MLPCSSFIISSKTTCNIFHRDSIYRVKLNSFSPLQIKYFLKLENNALCIDPNPVQLSFKTPYTVLATLQWILDQSLQENQP